MYEFERKSFLVERQVFAEFDFIIAHRLTLKEAETLCKQAFLEYFPEAENDDYFKSSIEMYVSAKQDEKVNGEIFRQFLRGQIKQNKYYLKNCIPFTIDKK